MNHCFIDPSEPADWLELCHGILALSPLRQRVGMRKRATDPSASVETPALSPLGERVARAGAFTSRRGTGEEVETLCGSPVAVERGNDHAALHACLGELFFQWINETMNR